jgi:hypothetical protein
MQLTDTSLPDVMFDPTMFVVDEDAMNEQLERVKVAQGWNLPDWSTQC